jgi:hypothetical protein
MAMASAEAQKNLKKESQERFRLGDPLARAESAGNAGLFDRHDEPPDQPRDFVQTVAVVIPDGLREPNEALIVAHLRYPGGYLARNNRRSQSIGLGVWHRITSCNTPAQFGYRLRMRLFGARFPAWPACGIAGWDARPQSSVRQKGQQTLIAEAVCIPCRGRAGAAHFPLCKARGLCYTLARREPLRFRLFLGSSAVEHSTVNRMVAGSNPARGANEFNSLAELFRSPQRALFRRGHIGGHLN